MSTPGHTSSETEASATQPRSLLQWLQTHPAGSASFIGAAILLQWLLPQWSSAVFVALAGSIGLWHGALDAHLMWALAGPQKLVRWAASYAVCSAVLLLVLLPHPAVALGVLLAVSVWHFGEPYTQPLMRLAHGGASVMLPALLAPATLGEELAQLVGDSVLLPLWTALAWGWLLLFAGLAGAAVAGCGPLASAPAPAGHSRWKALTQGPLFECVALGIAYAMLAPMLAFALFFVGFHTFQHTTRVHAWWRGRQRRGPAWVSAAPAAALLVTWVALGWLYPALRDASASATPVTDALRLGLTALAALTVPHLWVVARWQATLERDGA